MRRRNALEQVAVVQDWGTVILVQLLDEQGIPHSPLAGYVTAMVTRPDGSEFEVTLQASTREETHPAEPDPAISPDPTHNPEWRLAGGWAQFRIPQGMLTQSGAWQFRPRYSVDGGGSWGSLQAGTFLVVC